MKSGEAQFHSRLTLTEAPFAILVLGEDSEAAETEADAALGNEVSVVSRKG